MRLNEFNLPPVSKKELTYTEMLESRLAAELAIKPVPKFTALEWAIMEGGGSLEEADASDADLRARWGEFEPEDKPMLPRTSVGGAPAPTLWSAYDVIQNILGRNNVTDDDDELTPGMYYVYQSSEPPMFKDTDNGVGSINLPNLDSTAAKDVAIAAHEAYHAYVHNKSQGGFAHANEKIINNLAEKWLRKHLSGTALHIGLEQIVGSRISYGPNHMPKAGQKR